MLKNFKCPIILLAFILLACNTDDGDLVLPCDFTAFIDLDLYNEPSQSEFAIESAQINDNCLDITFSASGCDGVSWVVQLVSDIPLQAGDFGGANLSLKFTNPEVCEAYITKTYSFSVLDYLNGLEGISFNLQGWEEPLTFVN